MSLIAVREHRWALNRFAAYCTIKGLAASEVSSDTLIGFQRALEADCLSKDPVNIRKHTIAVWNMCHKRIPGWPDIRLSSPFKQAIPIACRCRHSLRALMTSKPGRRA
jgi:hypothetical protein